MIMKKILLVSLVLSSVLNAAPTSFDFKDPKGVNAIQFSLDSLLEPISGTGSGVSGLVSFDPANVGATSGKIVVTTASLTVSNSMMTDHLRGEKWLNAPVHPEIVFELVKLDNVQTSGTTTLGMMVAAALRKNKKMTITTKATDSISSNCTSRTEARMVTVRSVITCTSSEGGKEAFSDGNKACTRSTTSITFAPG